MCKRIIPLLLSLAVGLAVASCSARRMIFPTETTALTSPTNGAYLPAETKQILIPSETPETKPSSTTTPEQVIEPTSTEIPGTSTTTPVCFTASGTNLFAFMPDNQRILINTGTGVQIFNLKTLQEDRFIPAAKNIIAAALSPDGQMLAWSLEDNTIQLIRIADNKLLFTLQGHTDMIGKLKFSPSGDRLFSASHDTWVREWDRNGKLQDAFQPTGADNYPSEVLGIGVSPDGTMLATVPLDGPVKIWDLAEKKEVVALGGSGGYDTSDVAYSPDGQFMAADLATGMYVWQLSDRAQLIGGVNSMAFAFSPDGHYLAYSDIAQNYDVFLFSADGAHLLQTLERPQSPPWELVFSPDSTLLASAGVEMRIWRVKDGEIAYVGKAACP